MNHIKWRESGKFRELTINFLSRIHLVAKTEDKARLWHSDKLETNSSDT